MDPERNEILCQPFDSRRSSSTTDLGSSDDVCRIDLHCHSTFSDERIRFLPGIVFHPVSTPIEAYRLAKRRGMHFVTITDHDTIDGCKALLDECGPLDDFIVGEEVSVAFPEDRTVIHVNVFDHDEAQHRELQRLRGNLYDVVAYLREIDKLFVMNHLTWTQQHRVLKRWQIEKILELFDVFEGLNGTRSYVHNAFAWRATRGLNKVLVAGSDSHTTRMGMTYTRTRGRTRADVISAIRAGQAEMCGQFGTPESLNEDIWAVISANAERVLENERKGWKRWGTRMVRQVGARVYPLASLGYHKRQNTLLAQFTDSLPLLPCPTVS